MLQSTQNSAAPLVRIDNANTGPNWNFTNRQNAITQMNAGRETRDQPSNADASFHFEPAPRHVDASGRLTGTRAPGGAEMVACRATQEEHQGVDPHQQVQDQDLQQLW